MKTEAAILKVEILSRPHALKNWQRHLLTLAFFLALTVWLLWEVVTNAGRSLEGWGDALLQVWTLDWDAHALATNPFNLFNANIFYPYANSLAFSESLIGQALLVTPLIWLTGNPVLGYNLLLLLSFVLSGWAMYLLVYEMNGKWTASVAAGLIFAFFPHRFGQLSHLHLLATEWMPFGLLFLRRFVLRKRPLDAFLFALFFAMQALSSTYLGLFMVVVVGLYLLYHASFGAKAFLKKPGEAFKKLFPLALALLLAFLIILPFYLPYLSVQAELGFERSPAEVVNYSAQPYYYLDAAKENKLNQLLYAPAFSFNWWNSARGGERGLYLGLLASLLAVAGMALAWRRRKLEKDGLFYILLAILAVIFTFGPIWNSGRFGAIPLPYALLYYFVPGFQGLRVPVRFIYVVALAVAVLAGFAVAALQRRWKFKTAYLAVPLLALLCLEYASDVNYLNSNALRQDPPAVNRWLAEHEAGAVLNVPLSSSDSSNLLYQYWARTDWQPLMNGFSGFMPPAYDALKKAFQQEFPSRRLLELLQGLEVRYLVINSADPTVKPLWSRIEQGLAGEFSGQVSLATRFDGTYIYELKTDIWVRNLSQWLKPDDPLYFVGYNRSDPQLLELPAYYLTHSGVTKAEKLYGTINVGFKSLPPLPSGQKAAFLLLQTGEDPTLYGFRREDLLYRNSLLELYRSSPQLLARLDFTRNTATGNIAFGQTPSAATHVRVAFAATAPAQVVLKAGSLSQSFTLAAGLSVVTMNSGTSRELSFTGDKVTVAWAELWQGDSPDSGKLELRPDVALVTASAQRQDNSGVAQVRLVSAGGNYTATLDVYNYPWGSHPSGHYGYWSVAVQGVGGTLEYRLDLPTKQMSTNLNGQAVTNYPPDPKDLDINSYGRVGDFRANLTLYAGNKLLGSVRLFDFTLWADGDRADPSKRRLTAFKGYDTPISFLVLPPAP